MDVRLLCLLPLGYLSGALPFAYWIARLVKGIDIRQVGSGNPGAANVFRTVGPAWGALTMVLDAAKGAAPVGLSHLVAPGRELLAITVGLLAVVGHTCSLFLGGKGGKGVMTSAGVFAVLMPVPLAVSALTFAIVLALTRYISLGSVCAALALPLAVWFRGSSGPLIGIALMVSAWVIYRHRANLARLRQGMEPKIELPWR